jgi:NADH:ubiquinone reductase (H+-translocating)
MRSISGYRVVILGAGFGGLYTALYLEKHMREIRGLEVTLISRENYFQMTPLLFEAGSGVLEARHAVQPIRSVLRQARFVEARIEGVDLDRRVVHALQVGTQGDDTQPYEVGFDHLVVALGGVTNTGIIPGAEDALTFKTLADAIYLRNKIIDLMEQADVEPDEARKRELLTFVIIGAGLVGVELVGELTEFVDNLCAAYPRVNRRMANFHLIEAGPKVMPEMERDLAEYAAEKLRARGVNVLVSTPVQRVEKEVVHLPEGKQIRAATIIVATGVKPNPILERFPLEKDKKGRLVVDAMMQCAGRESIWALGDCAAIPRPDGTTYPPLAQHALREAKVLAGNIAAAMRGGEIKPFVYESMGVLASLGHFSGVGRVTRFKVKGFIAWWVWRTYYLTRMPRWERRLRIMFDWTIALFFKNDIVKLDLFGKSRRPSEKRD